MDAFIIGTWELKKLMIPILPLCGSIELCSGNFAVVTPFLAVTRCGCLDVDSTNNLASPVNSPL